MDGEGNRLNCLSEPQHEGSCGSLVWGGGGAVCFPSLEAGFGCCIFGGFVLFQEYVDLCQDFSDNLPGGLTWKRALQGPPVQAFDLVCQNHADMALWDGSGTSKGYPFEVDVMGQRRARLVLSLYDLGLRDQSWSVS